MIQLRSLPKLFILPQKNAWWILKLAGIKTPTPAQPTPGPVTQKNSPNKNGIQFETIQENTDI